MAGLSSITMDMVTAFLNRRIDRDNIYMEMPLGINWLALSGSGSNGSKGGAGDKEWKRKEWFFC